MDNPNSLRSILKLAVSNSYNSAKRLKQKISFSYFILIYQLYLHQLNWYDDMNNKNPTATVLYLIEQAIKEYRKISQRNISKIVKDITIDQCLVLIILNKDDKISQNELANLVFKDNASITRMIELMVKKDYLNRTIHKEDRRKFNLEITEKGKKTLELINPIAKLNRETALNGLSLEEINLLEKTLNKIITNCKI